MAPATSVSANSPLKPNSSSAPPSPSNSSKKRTLSTATNPHSDEDDAQKNPELSNPNVRYEATNTQTSDIQRDANHQTQLHCDPFGFMTPTNGNNSNTCHLTTFGMATNPCGDDIPDDKGIDPHDLMLLKVIGRGTFAQQVALAQHTPTQSMCVVKTLDKATLVQRRQVRHTITEKKVLQELGGHPFIVQLYSSFQTDRDLNFVLEYCQGGELFYHLQQQKAQKFDEQATRFYAAEVLSALQELHSKGIVYRDLKPENVLLDADGHVKLADFGFAKQGMDEGKRTYSFCGSPEYLSPEMVTKDGHGIETDMWSFGCFCYELLTGSPPFQDDNMARLFDRIQSGRIWYPSYLSGHVVSLLKGLLRVTPSSRLTAEQAMKHPFFQSLNWEDLQQRQILPPIVPICASRDCTQNFDDGFTNEPVVSLRLETSELRKRLRKNSETQPIRTLARIDDFTEF